MRPKSKKNKKQFQKDIKDIKDKKNKKNKSIKTKKQPSKTKKQYSTLKNSTTTFIHKFLKKYKIKSVVDLGCGDFRIGLLLYGKKNIDYTGYDAYKGVIDYNNDKFKEHQNFHFIHSDFTSVKDRENINNADLCIIKDVLQHLPNDIIIKFMDYITKSNKFKYILLINCYNTTPENTKVYRKDIVGGEFSSLSALRYPLNKYGGRVIYKWDTKEVSLITL